MNDDHDNETDGPGLATGVYFILGLVFTLGFIFGLILGRLL